MVEGARPCRIRRMACEEENWATNRFFGLMKTEGRGKAGLKAVLLRGLMAIGP